jgi:hypothetical protein
MGRLQSAKGACQEGVRQAVSREADGTHAIIAKIQQSELVPAPSIWPCQVITTRQTDQCSHPTREMELVALHSLERQGINRHIRIRKRYWCQSQRKKYILTAGGASPPSVTARYLVFVPYFTALAEGELEEWKSVGYVAHQ